MRATSSVTQRHSSEQLRRLLVECLTITYNAVHYAEENGVHSRRGMRGFYQTLKGVELPSCYRVACITRACAVVESRKRSERRGVGISFPRPLRPAVCVISGFFITMKGRLFIPLRRDRYFDLQLEKYTLNKLAGGKVRSLTITPESLAFCYSKDVNFAPVERVFGVDRNEKNITFGDRLAVTQVGMGKVVKIRQTTREVIASLRRNDVRIRGRLTRNTGRGRPTGLTRCSIL